MSENQLAERIAEAILGKDGNRVAIRGGTWPDKETNLGGLCRSSLVKCIAEELHRATPPERKGEG